MADVQSLYHTLAEADDLVFDATDDLAYEKMQFETAVRKGRFLRKMMLADDQMAGQMFTPPRGSACSAFHDVKDLDRWGYLEGTMEHASDVVTNLLEAIGLNSGVNDKGNDLFVDHVHRNHSFAGAVLYQASWAEFSQAIIPREGLIVAIDNVSPLKALKAAGMADLRAPPLKFWSDVAYLQWKSRTEDCADLKYVLRYFVTNDITNAVIDTIFRQNRTKTQPWPGTTYHADSLEGQALLGTPNGSSIAYLLVQHKMQLGHKTVEKITVFYNDDPTELMLLFHIKDATKQSHVSEVN